MGIFLGPYVLLWSSVHWDTSYQDEEMEVHADLLYNQWECWSKRSNRELIYFIEFAFFSIISFIYKNKKVLLILSMPFKN